VKQTPDARQVPIFPLLSGILLTVSLRNVRLTLTVGRVMNESFNKAVNIAVRYFALSGVEDDRTTQSISDHVRDQLQEGETRPVMLIARSSA